MSVLTPGFAHAAEAQSCFRAVLRALSRPGEIVTLGASLTPPEPLSIAAAALLLTLADATTTVSLEPAAQDWLLFHTGARLADKAAADFVVTRTRPPLGLLRAGTDDEPEAGATLILDVEALDGPAYRLTGPGIAEAATIRLPLDQTLLDEWRAQRAIAPRGVDMLLCAGRRILGLPRSVAIEVA
jgi:alpha-D-ribose 1-methylphosphonate 5-triphosphate synthase subunit PhnH